MPDSGDVNESSIAIEFANQFSVLTLDTMKPRTEPSVILTFSPSLLIDLSSLIDITPPSFAEAWRITTEEEIVLSETDTSFSSISRASPSLGLTVSTTSVLPVLCSGEAETQSTEEDKIFHLVLDMTETVYSAPEAADTIASLSTEICCIGISGLL